MSKKEYSLISCCLIGLCTRYDGKTKEHPEWKKLQEKYHLLPVCPEQLGGLPTPRTSADNIGGDGFDVLDKKAAVISKEGHDFTEQFVTGAEQTLQIAKKFNCHKAILKRKSPSCSSGEFTGVAAALLERNGVEIIGL